MFTYDLPPERIAQRPVGTDGARANSKLLCAKRSENEIVFDDKTFAELPQMLCSGDLLVLNNSRVIPSRFFARQERTGKEIEILLVTKLGDEDGGEIWEALGKPLRALQQGETLLLSNNIAAEVGPRTGDQRSVILLLKKTSSAHLDATIGQLIERDAVMPIPPYIRNGRADELDRGSYQTVFSEVRGSIAAPTAGLHFTPALLEALTAAGVSICYVTLHVGVGSFQPIDADSLDTFSQASERYCVPAVTATVIKKQINSRKRVVAVGTTVVRTLESWWLAGATDDARFNATNLFIAPGFSFSVVDALITNFHQPRSTHLQLVGAFIGESATKHIYEHALNNDYRFLSYGDAMLLEK